MYPDISVRGFFSVNAKYFKKGWELIPIVDQNPQKKGSHKLARQEGRSSAW